MRLLVDACVWGGARAALAAAGQDAVWVGDWEHYPGDEEILAQQAEICGHLLAHYGSELRAGAIVTAAPGRVRVRPTD